jgi:hypothetical protein
VRRARGQVPVPGQRWRAVRRTHHESARAAQRLRRNRDGRASSRERGTEVRIHAWTGEPLPLERADHPASRFRAAGRLRFRGARWSRCARGLRRRFGERASSCSRTVWVPHAVSGWLRSAPVHALGTDAERARILVNSRPRPPSADCSRLSPTRSAGAPVGSQNPASKRA